MLIKQIQSRPRHRYLWHNGQRFNSAVVYGRPLNHRPFDIRSYDIFFVTVDTAATINVRFYNASLTGAVFHGISFRTV
jgi:hypothetical protein